MVIFLAGKKIPTKKELLAIQKEENRAYQLRKKLQKEFEEKNKLIETLDVKQETLSNRIDKATLREEKLGTKERKTHNLYFGSRAAKFKDQAMKLRFTKEGKVKDLTEKQKAKIEKLESKFKQNFGRMRLGNQSFDDWREEEKIK